MRLFVCLLMASTLACGAPEKTYSQTQAASAEPGSSLTLPDEALGAYAIRAKLAAIVDLPVLGRTARTTTAWILAQLVAKDQGYDLIENTCRIDVGSAGPVHQVMDDAVARSIPTRTTDFRIFEENGESKFERGWSLTVLGAQLQGRDGESLPTSRDDARVFDQDQDGKPGVTVHVRSPRGNGDVYIVKRYNSQYFGSFTNGEFRGTYKDEGDQEVLEATNPRIKVNPPSWQNPDLRRSPMLMVKLAESLDCDQFLAARTTIFPNAD